MISNLITILSKLVLDSYRPASKFLLVNAGLCKLQGKRPFFGGSPFSQSKLKLEITNSGDF